MPPDIVPRSGSSAVFSPLGMGVNSIGTKSPPWLSYTAINTMRQIANKTLRPRDRGKQSRAFHREIVELNLSSLYHRQLNIHCEILVNHNYRSVPFGHLRHYHHFHHH